MSLWREQCPTLKWNEVIGMYINDCLQYLEAHLKNEEVNILNEPFPQERCSEEDLIYMELKELKDLCMQVYGQTPANWKGN